MWPAHSQAPSDALVAEPTLAQGVEVLEHFVHQRNVEFLRPPRQARIHASTTVSNGTRLAKAPPYLELCVSDEQQAVVHHLLQLYHVPARSRHRHALGDGTRIHRQHTYSRMNSFR